MNHSLNVAVIGMGQMGTHHARIYQKLPFVNLSAVCEWDDARRAAAQKEFGCATYKSYKELLENPDINAVSIVLPDNMHYEAVEIAVKNRKHILLEKPLAKDLVDGEAIYSIVKDYDRIFTVGFLLRFDPRFTAIKEALDRGEIGEIINIYCRRNSPIFGPRRYIGASDLSMHVMIHDIDYINWFTSSRPLKVFAKARSVLLKEHGMKDTIYALVTYESGALACLEACWVLPENSPTLIDDKVEVIGTKGVAYVDSCDNGVRFVTGRRVDYPDSRHWPYCNGMPSGDLFEELLAFVNNILNDTKSIITPHQALDSLRVVDAIERSIAQGYEVDL